MLDTRFKIELALKISMYAIEAKIFVQFFGGASSVFSVGSSVAGNSTANMTEEVYLLASHHLPSSPFSSSRPVPSVSQLDYPAQKHQSRQNNRLCVAAPAVGITVYDVGFIFLAAFKEPAGPDSTLAQPGVLAS